MGNTDWLPQNHEALFEKVEITWSYLEDPTARERMGLIGNIAKWLDDEFSPVRLNFINAFLAWRNPATRTPLMTTALKDSESKLVPMFRELYTGFLKNNPLITNTDLQAMGLPLRSDGRHQGHAQIPHTLPDATIDTSVIREITVGFKDRGRDSHAKPDKVFGVEIRWGVLEHIPGSTDELVHSEIDTRSPYTITFQENERGKTVYICLRWTNTRGEKGPWSEIISAIIP
jgi:hypothetical protein